MEDIENQRWEILLIDDDEDDYIILHKMLQEEMDHPFHLEWTQDSLQFLELAGSGKYHLSLVDYRLGDETGLELIARLYATYPEIPIILITGWHNYDIINAARQFGVSSFLHKSNLNGQMLSRTIRKVIQEGAGAKKL